MNTAVARFSTRHDQSNQKPEKRKLPILPTTRKSTPTLRAMARPRRGRLLAVAAVAVCLVAGLAPVALGAISDALDPLTPAEREAKYAEPRTSPLAMPFGASIGKGLMSLFPAFPISIDDIGADQPSWFSWRFGLVGFDLGVGCAMFFSAALCPACHSWSPWWWRKEPLFGGALLVRGGGLCQYTRKRRWDFWF